MTEEQRIEAARNKKMMEELVSHEGWKLLTGFGKGQVGSRSNKVLLEPTKEPFAVEYMKGEIQGIQLILATPEKLIEESEAILRIAAEQEGE